MLCKATNDGNGCMHCATCRHSEHEFFFSCRHKYRGYAAVAIYWLLVSLTIGLAWYVLYRV